VSPEPHKVAARLGFDQKTIGRLETRGHLYRLALTDTEIHDHLYHAHLAYLRALADHFNADLDACNRD
jgi:hypothetical protein